MFKKKSNLSDKIVAFSCDNYNTNFGGVERKGIKNIYAILNENLKTNISGIGCAAHILHNAMQICTDIYHQLVYLFPFSFKCVHFVFLSPKLFFINFLSLVECPYHLLEGRMSLDMKIH